MDGPLFSPNRNTVMKRLIKERRREALGKVAPLAGIEESMPNANAYNMAPRRVNKSPGFKPNRINERGIHKFNLGPAAGNRGPALVPQYAAAAAAAAASGRGSPPHHGKPQLNLSKLKKNNNNVNSTTIRNLTKKKKCCTMLGGGADDDDDRPSLFVPATNATCSLPNSRGRSSNKRRETRRRR
jgi:hypothetical protein